MKKGDLVRLKDPKDIRTYSRWNDPGWNDEIRASIGQLGKVGGSYYPSLDRSGKQIFYEIRFKKDDRIWVIFEDDLELITDPLLILKYGDWNEEKVD